MRAKYELLAAAGVLLPTLGATLHLFTRRACPGRSHLYYQRETIIRSDGRHERGFVGCST